MVHGGSDGHLSGVEERMALGVVNLGISDQSGQCYHSESSGENNAVTASEASRKFFVCTPNVTFLEYICRICRNLSDEFVEEHKSVWGVVASRSPS